jgi:hypothetical protein
MSEPGIADVMKAYADGAVAFAQRKYEVRLDFSEASLEDLDRILADRIKDGLVDAANLTAEQEDEVWVFCKLLGGYVGEVIIRNIGGHWIMKRTAQGSSTVALLAKGGVEGSPPQAIWKALTEGNKPMASYYRTLRVALGHGTPTMKDGVRSVSLPPLSREVPPTPPPGQAGTA